MQHTIEIRVRYHETDAQGHVHHANYLNYFELGRVELLRSMGHEYADLEAQGVILVVVEMQCRYFRPCRFGDTLVLQTSVENSKGVRIRHRYELRRGPTQLAQAHSTIACVDRNGRPRRLPPWLQQ